MRSSHTPPNDPVHKRSLTDPPGRCLRPIDGTGLTPTVRGTIGVVTAPSRRIERPQADVAVFGVQRRKGDRHRRPWVVRWAVEGRQRSRSFRIRVEADRFRSALLDAHAAGHAFDRETGEPVEWEPEPDDVQMHVWARAFLEEQWPDWAPRTRTSAVEALSRFVPLVVSPSAPPPPTGTRAHLASWLRPDGEVVDGEAAAWLDRWCLRLAQLDRASLAEADRKLARKADGSPLAAATAHRLRTAAKSCIGRAVDLGILDANPWPPSPRGRSRTKAARAKRPAIRSLPDPPTMARVLDAMSNHQPASRLYRAMTATSYYGGLRPSEVVMLRVDALTLPEDDWGRIEVTEADVDFDVAGETKTGERSVPIPPVLVDILRAWIDEHDLSGDDLIFRTRGDRRPTQSNWARALKRALADVGHPPIRVYDLRHSAATTWLGAGVPLGEVARRMGHSVQTLVSTYVGALQGDEEVANQRIASALRGHGQSAPSDLSG